jgi:hypothetical protein
MKEENWMWGMLEVFKETVAREGFLPFHSIYRMTI